MTSSRPSAVVFDLGGVLVDWDPRYLYRTLLATEDDVERFLAEVTTAEWNARQDAGRSWAEGVATLSAEHPHHAGLIAAYDERWVDTIGGAIDGTVDVLADLRAADTPVYALTNWSAEKFPLARERFPWLDWFDGIVVSGEERVVKPDPRIYRILLDRFGLEARSTVYIDDVDANVRAAAEIGFAALRFTGAQRLRADLEALGILRTLDAEQTAAE
jgi:2-haloacid dehalogenase